MPQLVAEFPDIGVRPYLFTQHHDGGRWSRLGELLLLDLLAGRIAEKAALQARLDFGFFCIATGGQQDGGDTNPSFGMHQSLSEAPQLLARFNAHAIDDPNIMQWVIRPVGLRKGECRWIRSENRQRLSRIFRLPPRGYQRA